MMDRGELWRTGAHVVVKRGPLGAVDVPRAMTKLEHSSIEGLDTQRRTSSERSSPQVRDNL